MALNLGELFPGIGSLAKDKDDVMNGSLDLTAVPPVDKSFTGNDVFFIKPIAMSPNGPYDFEIPASALNQYTELSTIRMLGSFSVKKSDGSGVAENAQLGLINYYPNSLWRSIEVEVNGKTLPQLTNTHYAYKAYIEHLISHDQLTCDSKLGEFCWTPNVQATITDYHNVIQRPGAVNMVNRYRDGLFYFDIELHFDFLAVFRLFPPGNNIRFKFTRNSDDFVLWYPKGVEQPVPPAYTVGEPKPDVDGNAPATGNEAGAREAEINQINAANQVEAERNLVRYKIVMKNLELQVKKLEVAEPIVKNHRAQIIKGASFNFPFVRTEVKTWQLPSGSNTDFIQGMFKGFLPSFLIVTLLDSKAFNGDRFMDPFYFKTFQLKRFTVYKNGKSVPTRPYYPSEEGYTRMYQDFLDNLGNRGNVVAGARITYDMYKTNSFMVCADLTPEGCKSWVTHSPEFGDISCDINTGDHTEAITVMGFASYNTLYSIQGVPNELVLPNEMIM